VVSLVYVVRGFLYLGLRLLVCFVPDQGTVAEIYKAFLNPLKKAKREQTEEEAGSHRGWELRARTAADLKTSRTFSG
jgi:hypothetical protein